MERHSTAMLSEFPPSLQDANIDVGHDCYETGQASATDNRLDTHRNPMSISPWEST
jgi:hypothetical protein